jgi:predicted HicB family RNase H-like nuclease
MATNTKGKEIKNDRYTYRITWSFEDQEYVGLCAEFPSLSWLARTPEESLQGIRKLVAEVIEDMKANNEPVPEPIATRKYSGKFMVRVTPEVHRMLAIQAAESNVSINRLVSGKLTKV